MPRRIILVPAILVILLAGVASGARTSLAADSCVTKPGATAPQGEHWYYRLDRAAHRPCWYLGPEGGKVAQAGAPRGRSTAHVAGSRPATVATAKPPAEVLSPEALSPEALSAYAERTRVATGGNAVPLRANPASPSFTTRWSDRPDSSDPTAYALASTSHEPVTGDGGVNAPDDLSPTAPVPARSDRAMAGKSDATPLVILRMLALIGGALALAVLIFRSAFSQPARLIVRSNPREQGRGSGAAFRRPGGTPSFGNPVVASQAFAARSPGPVRRAAGNMRRNDSASQPGRRDDSAPGSTAA